MLEKIKKKKYLIIGSMFLLSLGFFLVKNPKSALLEKKEKFKTTKVKRSDLQKTVSASGKVKSDQTVTLKFQASGQLAWVGVEVGDYVKKWQAIASLDKRKLEKSFQKIANDYLEERWDFEQTQDDYRETKDRQLVTDAIQRILDKSQFDLNKSTLNYEIADLAVKYATIFSPIDGIVTKIDAPIAGINITPATATFTIANPNKMIFEANIDEIDIGEIKKEQEAILILDAYPEEKIRSKIIQIAFQSQTTRGGGTVFPVKIELPENKNLKFKLGMNGDIDVVIEEKKNILVIPKEYVKTKNGKSGVYFLKNSKLKMREIKTGLTTLSQVEVLEGLDENEEIVLTKKTDDKK